jgi:hypothetical protein
MTATRFLLDNKCDDLILNDRRGLKPEDRIYASDIMEDYHQAKSKEDDLIDYIDYISGLIEYIKIIGDELDETSVLAYTHGWRSGRVEQGKDARSKLNKMAKGLLLPLPFGKEDNQ